MASEFSRERRLEVLPGGKRRKSPELDGVHKLADKLEPQLADKFVRAVSRYRQSVSISALAEAIALGDVDRALALFDGFDDAMSSLATQVESTVMAGGREGAKRVREFEDGD